MTKQSWDEFEDENGGEGSRLRGDSDITQEPKGFSVEANPKSKGVFPSSSFLTRGRGPAYALPEDQAMEREDEYRQYVLTLRPYALGLIGLVIGVIIGRLLFASAADLPQTLPGSGTFKGSPSLPPSTATTVQASIPSMAPIVLVTGSPTAPNPTNAPIQPSFSLNLALLREKDPEPSKEQKSSQKPVQSILDPRFGIYYFIAPDVTNRWEEQKTLRLKVKPTLTGDDQNGQFRSKVCDVKPNPPQKYAFPPQVYETSERPVSPSVFLRHVRQYKFALAEYYHQSRSNVSDMFYDTKKDPTGPKPALVRLARFFKAKLLSPEKMNVTVATLGTSVMSGHDNCHTYTYGPILRRALSHLLSPADPAIVMKNMGQNGDGPDQMNQMNCAWLTLGQADFVHSWYPMTDSAENAIQQMFMHRMIRQNHAQNIHLVSGEMQFVTPAMVDGGFITKNTNLRADIDWPPKHFWGRRDDGLCHNVTREGAVGVSMQNWHLGPIGFQILVDEATFLYADALEMALESIIEGTELPEVIPNNKLKFVPAGNCPQVKSYGYLPYFNYLCSDDDQSKVEDGQDALAHTKVHCATGFFPQFNGQGFDIDEDMFAPAIKSNPFPLIGHNAVGWNVQHHKQPSRYTGASERGEGKYDSMPECADFRDTGLKIVLAKGSATETEWLTFRVPERTRETLQGVKRVNIYICTGQRRTGYSGLNDFRAVFGINGQIWGEESAGPWGPCMKINGPNAVDTFTPGTVFGLRFYAVNASIGAQSIVIGNIQLVSADHEKLDPTPVPSRLAAMPTYAPSPGGSNPTLRPSIVAKGDIPDAPDKNKPTQVPHPGDDDGDDQDNKPTEVPHPVNDDDDDQNNKPTEVPHPEDNDDGPTQVPHPGDRRRRRRRRNLAMNMERIPQQERRFDSV